MVQGNFVGLSEFVRNVEALAVCEDLGDWNTSARDHFNTG